MSLVTTLAQAVVAELNRHAFSQPFDAVFSVKPQFDLADLETLHVVVVPKTLETTAVSRSTVKYTVVIDIGVIKRIGSLTPEEAVEKLGNLVDEIIEYLHSATLDDFTAAQCVTIANEPIYSPEHLTQQRTFFSVINVQYCFGK